MFHLLKDNGSAQAAAPEVSYQELQVEHLQAEGEIQSLTFKMDSLNTAMASVDQILLVANENLEHGQALMDAFSAIHNEPINDMFGIVSFESEEDVVTATESVKDTIKNFAKQVYETIKKIVSRILDMIRNSGARVLAMQKRVDMVDGGLKKIKSFDEKAFAGYTGQVISMSAMSQLKGDIKAISSIKLTNVSSKDNIGDALKNAKSALASLGYEVNASGTGISKMDKQPEAMVRKAQEMGKAGYKTTSAKKLLDDTRSVLGLLNGLKENEKAAKKAEAEASKAFKAAEKAKNDEEAKAEKEKLATASAVVAVCASLTNLTVNKAFEFTMIALTVASLAKKAGSKKEAK